MTRLALFAVIVLAAACANEGDPAVQDTVTPAPVIAPAADTADTTGRDTTVRDTTAPTP